MDNTLIPAALVLIVTNLVFAYLANHWRTLAKRRERTALEGAVKAASARIEGYDLGLTTGLKQATGGMYLAAVRTEAGEDVLKALRSAGRRLLKDFEEPIVQVPETV